MVRVGAHCRTTVIRKISHYCLLGWIYTEKPRIKLYTDKEGRKNGEALVTYLRHESVPLAIDLLDDTEYRSGVEKGRIRVQQVQLVV